MHRTINRRLEKILLEAFLDERKPKWYQVFEWVDFWEFRKKALIKRFEEWLGNCTKNQEIRWWFKGELSGRTLAKYGYTQEEFFKLDFFKQKCIQL